MTELGIGVRVYVGMDTVSFADQQVRHAVCATGTIVDGPYEPDVMNIQGYWLTARGWEVTFDNGGAKCAVIERLLFPIDDFDDEMEVEDELVELV